MRIENFRTENKNGMSRAVATVTWENSDHKTRDIYFETKEEYGQDLVSNPDTFAVGSYLPAMYFGEKRLYVEGGLSPVLKEGMLTAMQWYRFWYGEKYFPLEIEGERTIKLYQSSTPKGVGLFLSGGVDSLYTLRMNRLGFPVGHPASIRDGFLVHGFDIYHDESVDKKMETFDRAVATMSEVAKDAQVNLIPVFTNVRHLYSNVKFWMYWYFASALSAVAHSFAPRLSDVWISSDGYAAGTTPWGSHPSIDYNYSSHNVQVHHGPLRGRFEKVKLIADWDAALNNMRVCTGNPDGLLNCGDCEKCIRTMTMLVAAGKLKQCKAFPINDVTPRLLREITITDKKNYKADYYYEVLKPLAERGRGDLVKVLEKELGWVGDIKRFDRTYLNEGLAHSWSLIRKILKPKAI